jgi:NAD dependent epimerase/dehydratase family enzyme
MSILLTEGRFTRPKRLLELGYQFEYGEINNALKDLLK